MLGCWVDRMLRRVSFHGRYCTVYEKENKLYKDDILVALYSNSYWSPSGRFH
jgi:hypothetical protein